MSDQQEHHYIYKRFGNISPFFLSFIDAIPDIIGIQDHNHNILLYNKRGYEFLGVNAEEIKGKKCYELIGQRKICDNCATEKTYETKTPAHVVRHFPEINIWFDIRSFPVLDEQGNISFVIEHLRDITLQKIMEEDLKLTRNNFIEKSRFLETLVNNLPGMVYRCKNDKEWTMEYIRGRFYELTGYQPEDVTENRKLSFNDLIAQEYREKLWEKWQDILSRKEVFNLEYEIITAAGERKWVWEQGEGVFDVSGNLLALEGFIMDISTLKKVNEELENKNREYQKINEELLRAKEKAEESDNLKTAFLANVSHELRTPLNGIIGFAELMAKKDLSPEKKKQYLGIIKKSGSQLMTFVNDIIEISRIETGQADVALQVFSSAELMKNVYDFFKYQCIHPDVMFVKGIVDDIQMNSDESKIRQVLNNLISNAIKFTAKGKIETGLRIKDGMAEFYVKDTGMGIREEDKDRIFDRFVQGITKGNVINKGSGLGLAIAKNYAGLLGGKLWFESEWGKGSCFYFAVPLR
jgi:PAS domain S-box-containing protein